MTEPTPEHEPVPAAVDHDIAADAVAADAVAADAVAADGAAADRDIDADNLDADADAAGLDVDAADHADFDDTDHDHPAFNAGADTPDSADTAYADTADDDGPSATGEDDDNGDDNGEDDGEDDDDEDQYLDPWNAGVDPDARGAVTQWNIVAVGRRTEDFIGRDCLYASLLRDHRATWFRNYLKRPSPWMEEQVAHISDMAKRRQALQCVVLDFQHKKHLARMFPVVREAFGDDAAWFARLWRCTPYTVKVARKNRGLAYIRECGYPHLCPWCHARKVVSLYSWIKAGPLRKPSEPFLLLGKPAGFIEPFGGLDDEWQHADHYSYAHGVSAHGHYARYYGLDADRAVATRRRLMIALRQSALGLGGNDGLIVHQMGSGQLQHSGQRTFLHDLGVIAAVSRESPAGVGTFKNLRHFTTEVDVDFTEKNALRIRWLVLPSANASALRVMLAGTTFGHLRAKFKHLDEEWWKGSGYEFGVRGALSWQPTFFLDDQMWLRYVEAVRHRRLYQAFGSWKSIGAIAAESRSSVGKRYGKAQTARYGRNRQQTGNRHRHQDAEKHRNDLLEIARMLWPQILAEGHQGPGRPPHRQHLAGCLAERGQVVSERDLKWLMSRLR